MGLRASSSRVVFACAAVLAAAACAPGKRGISPLAAAKPEWIAKGSGVFVEGGRKGFRGVGRAQGIRSQELAMGARLSTKSPAGRARRMSIESCRDA